jgi:hypothetical protein
MQWCEKENKEIKLVAIDSTPKTSHSNERNKMHPPKIRIKSFRLEFTNL